MYQPSYNVVSISTMSQKSDASQNSGGRGAGGGGGNGSNLGSFGSWFFTNQDYNKTSTSSAPSGGRGVDPAAVKVFPRLHHAYFVSPVGLANALGINRL